MGLISWIIFGAVAGWIASLIVGNNSRQGCLGNIIIGVLGALIGGAVMQFVTGNRINFGFDVTSFGVAVLGAVGLLVLLGRRRR